MAVVNTKSTQVTNADAAIQTQNKAKHAEGRLYCASETVAIASGDSVGSTYRMLRVHSSWSLKSIRLFFDDIGTTGAADVGLYQTAANGGAVVDADAYASAVVMNAGANTGGLELLFESGIKDINEVNEEVWEDAGLSADPGRWYDLVLTLTGAADGAGDVTMIVTFTRGGS
jgi:hypothetical protein